MNLKTRNQVGPSHAVDRPHVYYPRSQRLSIHPQLVASDALCDRYSSRVTEVVNYSTHAMPNSITLFVPVITMIHYSVSILHVLIHRPPLESLYHH